MGNEGTEASPEREQTDESLRIERENTDRALALSKHAVEQDADDVVQRARNHADAILGEAREKADQRQDRLAPEHAPSPSITRERLLEDQTLRDERATADETLQREREQNARALTSLLPAEREETDRYLLTERAHSDEALANRDDFLGIVSHDLRDLLGGIAMSVALLAKSAPDTEAGRRTLTETDRIRRHAARMNRLIGDLLDVASIDAGRLTVTAVPADAAALLAEAVDAFRAAASTKGISLVPDLVAGPLPADFDHDRLFQVLANLITNAIKFTSQGGTVRVRAARTGDDLRFWISDTGSGIPAEMLEAIFERYGQVGKNDRRGVGLGLYISRCIVEAHGGRIWAESKPGEGSTVCFTVPVAHAPRHPGGVAPA
jgi:signal transduction histidine kinase